MPVRDKEKRNAYMRQWWRTPAGQAAKVLLRTSGKDRERAKHYRLRNPERVQATMDRYRATEKGKMTIWSLGTAKNIRQRYPKSKITPLQLRQLWEKQKGLCALTGWPMLLRDGYNGQRLDAVSVDRIDNNKTYLIENIRLVINQANVAKSFGSDDRLIELCKAILRTRGGVTSNIL